MQSVLGSEPQRSRTPGQSSPCVLWSVDLKLTHVDWNPDATLIHFQAQYLTICELDYSILQGEIQNVPKSIAAVDIGEFCLVEDVTSAHWYRGRVQNRKDDLFDVFLIDHGNVLSVDITHISSCSSDLFILSPKIVCGFFANVLLLQGCSCSVIEKYFSSLIGQNVTGYIQAFLPHKVLLLEASDINNDLVQHGFGRHVDTDTFLLLVELLTEVSPKQNIEPVPDLLIEKPRGQEFSFKPSGLQGHDQILSFCGPRLPSGTRVKVQVTAAINPGLFYCQMSDKDTDLWEMSKKLAEVSEYKRKDHSRKTHENLGLLCSVKRKDGKWYRGIVQYLPVNSQVRVLFIDYGFSESVKVENIHSLPSDIFSTPIMAFPCSLSCLSDQDEALKTQQLSLLKEGLLGKVLEADIRSYDEEKHLYSISLISAKDNHSKNTELIQEIPDTKIKSDFCTKALSTQNSYLNFEAIVGEVLGKTLKEEEVQVNSVFVGYVVHVYNPNHFWIRTQKRNEEFEEMTTKIAEHFNQVKLDEDVLLNPEPGTMCCAVYEEDMHFYRGVVTDTLEHGAEVLFIDFGNIEKVPHMLIKKIPETFASKSALGICCTLNVFPLDEVWTSSASDFFKQAVSDKALQVHVVQVRKNKFVVDLFEMGSQNNKSITELLIASKPAEFWNNIPTEPVGQKSGEKTSCPRFDAEANTNGCSNQWEGVEEEEKTCEKATEKPQTPVSFKVLSIKPGGDFTVRCINMSSPSDFWCQPLGKVQDLEGLMDAVQEYYSTHRVPLKTEEACCVVKLPKDGKYYRAISADKQNSIAKVVLVDYGLTITTKEHNLQAIMPEFLHLEEQAFRCSLYNIIEPVDPKNSEDWSLEVLDLMKDFISTGALRCKIFSQLNVKNKGLCNVVDLYNPQTKQSLTKLLLDKGLAREVTISTKQVSAAVPESFAYSSFDLTPGKEEQVFVTHVSSHFEVYCHLERNTESIEELESKISEEREVMAQANTRAVVRKLCLAKYLDGKWYRGLAHPASSPLHLNVFFVDYGNTSLAEKTNVMFIPRDSVELLYTPMQAVKCSLASVTKGKTNADVKEWLHSVTFNKVRAVIAGQSDDGSFDVELFDGDVNINEKVNELIQSLSPKPKTGVSFATSGKRMNNKILPRRDTKSAIKCKNLQKGLSSRYPTSNAHSSTKAGRVLYKETANTKKGDGKKQYKYTKVKTYGPAKPQETSPVKQQREYLDTNPTTKHPQVPQLSSLPDMKVCAGFRAKCFASHVDSVSSFFLQLSEDEPDILKMGDDLNSSAVRDSLKTVSSLRINDLVLAEFEDDGALYRAAVTDYKGSLKVEFIDYGNSTVVEKEKIYYIPKECLAQPRFSIPCSLLDTDMYESDESFTEAVMEKPLLVDFVSECRSQWKVKVEIINAAEKVEPAVASSVEIENKKEAPESAPAPEEKVRSCEDNFSNTVTQNEATTSQRTLHTADTETLTFKKLPRAQLPPTVFCCRRHRRTATRKRKDLQKSQKKTKVTSSVKSKSDGAIIPTTVQAKDTENATILSVLSNGNFYIRLNKTSKVIDALESHIAENLYKYETVAEEDVKKGLKCLVQVDEDEPWHRAVVRHVGLKSCEVFLVDHGKTEEIPNGSIRRQCSDLGKTQNLAVLCKVNCLEGECVDKLWCETLKPMIEKEVKLVFVQYSDVEDLWVVEIILNGLFLMAPASLRNNEDLINAESRNEMEEELDSSPTQELIFAPVDMDKAYSGIAAAVKNPLQFCVVLEDLLLVMNKVSIILDTLPEQLSPLPEAHRVSGKCCLIKSENKWCRAEIVNLDTTALLYLVDYGHYESMPCNEFSKLKRLPEDVSNLPKVTYPSILRGVKPIQVDGQWTDEAAVFFQQCLYQKNLQIFFREFVSNSHWKVDILADGVHVAKELVDAGHASYIDNMLGVRFQEQSLCKAALCSPDSEEECAQDDDGSDGSSDLFVEWTDEADEKMPLSFTSGCRQCLLM